MSLDILLAPKGSDDHYRHEPHVSFRSNGYYWFIYPLLESLRERTGQYIDLYGNASFQDDDLAALEETLSQAREQVDRMPESWSVQTGTYLGPPATPRYNTVLKSEFLRLLQAFLDLVAEARRSDARVLCVDD